MGEWARPSSSTAVFEVGDDMVAVLVGDPDSHPARLALAAEHCPTNAITVRG